MRPNHISHLQVPQTPTTSLSPITDMRSNSVRELSLYESGSDSSLSMSSSTTSTRTAIGTPTRRKNVNTPGSLEAGLKPIHERSSKIMTPYEKGLLADMYTAANVLKLFTFIDAGFFVWWFFDDWYFIFGVVFSLLGYFGACRLRASGALLGFYALEQLCLIGLRVFWIIQHRHNDSSEVFTLFQHRFSLSDLISVIAIAFNIIMLLLIHICIRRYEEATRAHEVIPSHWGLWGNAVYKLDPNHNNSNNKQKEKEKEKENKKNKQADKVPQ